MKLLRGKPVAEKIKLQIRKQINKRGLSPGLSVILVGNDPASKTYVGLKEKASKEVGIKCRVERFRSDVSEQKIISFIKSLNQDKKTNSILVQLPLPKGLATDKIVNAINPDKDPDYFHPKNLNKIIKKDNSIFPPTLHGIIKLLKQTRINLTSKKAVIICNSKIFAQPLIAALKQERIKVQLLSSKQKDLADLTKKADIIITAVGKKWLVNETMIKENAILIDVGFTKIGNKVYGDINPDVEKKAAFLSPVPGGVGPLTVAYLMKNILTLAKIQQK